MTLRGVLALLLVGMFIAVAVAPEAEAQRQRGRGGGKGGGGGGAVTGSQPGMADNPMSYRASREVQERAGLFNSGLVPKYPTEARCLEVKSFFGDRTRHDGSQRVAWANHGLHVGFDITAREGTPLVAIADGEVVHKHSGGRLVGHQIFLRHRPEDTGLSTWLYSKYKHFRELPNLDVGQRVRLGQVIGFSGDTGTTGGHYGDWGYPHLHLPLYVSDGGDYKVMAKMVVPAEVRHLDPLALYLPAGRRLTDNHAIRALTRAEKVVAVPYQTPNGQRVPADTRMIWPFLCKPG